MRCLLAPYVAFVSNNASQFGHLPNGVLRQSVFSWAARGAVRHPETQQTEQQEAIADLTLARSALFRLDAQWGRRVDSMLTLVGNPG